MNFKDDQLENEKNEPHEASSLKFINIPIVLLAFFIGSGITFLAIQTPNTSIESGDSRTYNSSNDSSTELGVDKKTLESSSSNALLQTGKQLYSIHCQACHQSNGSGIPGAFPPLAGSKWVNEDAARLVAILLFGIDGEITVKGQTFQGVMPEFKSKMSPDEISAVGTYIRDSFGNSATEISSDVVHQIIEKLNNRATPWQGEGELNNFAWKKS